MGIDDWCTHLITCGICMTWELRFLVQVVHVHVHERSVIETRRSKATTPEDNSREKEELPQAGLEPATFCIPGRRSTN